MINYGCIVETVSQKMIHRLPEGTIRSFKRFSSRGCRFITISSVQIDGRIAVVPIFSKHISGGKRVEIKGKDLWVDMNHFCKIPSFFVRLADGGEADGSTIKAAHAITDEKSRMAKRKDNRRSYLSTSSSGRSIVCHTLPSSNCFIRIIPSAM